MNGILKLVKAKKDKTIKLSPQIGGHDLTFKLKQAKGHIDKGHKVRFQMVVHGRTRYMGFNYEKVLRDMLEEFKPINVWKKGHDVFFYTNTYVQTTTR